MKQEKQPHQNKIALAAFACWLIVIGLIGAVSIGLVSCMVMIG